jgi:hypothetical protein
VARGSFDSGDLAAGPLPIRNQLDQLAVDVVEVLSKLVKGSHGLGL